MSTAAAVLCWAGFSGGVACAEAPSQAYTCAEYLDDISSTDRVDGSKLVRSLSAGYFAWGLIPWAKLNPDDPNAAKERIIKEALNGLPGDSECGRRSNIDGGCGAFDRRRPAK